MGRKSTHKKVAADAFGTLYDAARHWASERPSSPALVSAAGSVLSYGDLLDRIDAIGATLNGNGLGRNDRIAIVHPGGRDMVLAILGIWSYATAVPVNPDLTVREFAGYLRQTGVHAVAIADVLEPRFRAAIDELGLPVLLISPDGALSYAGGVRQKGSDPDGFGPARPDDILSVVGTSGTTSRSKVVPLRHRQSVCRNWRAMNELRLGPDDRCLNMLRLFHSGGLNQGTVPALISGGSFVALENFSASGFFDTLETAGPTWCTGAYTFYHAIYRELPARTGELGDASSRLRFLRSGTGWLNPEVARQVEEAFGIPLVVTYGTSETGSITSEPLPPSRRKQGSVGLPTHDGVVVADADGKPLPAGDVGEILVRGPSVIDGYENDDAA
ncbi:MAG: AMP-binding protein, partial [Pseudomonadota bacterium]